MMKFYRNNAIGHCREKIVPRIILRNDAPHAFDLSHLPRLTGRALVALYRYTLSPILGPRCRHLPSCSEYADDAITRFGLWAGGWMALARIARCHPFGTQGLDFVPDELPRHARWWLPWRYARWRGTNTDPPHRHRA